jgi:hypothetical protein
MANRPHQQEQQHQQQQQAQQPQQAQQAQQGQSMMGGQNVGSPISNEAYDIISALHAKLEGLEAYRKYANDGNGQLWQRLTQTELDGVRTLCGELERIVKEGKLQVREPGKTS